MVPNTFSMSIAIASIAGYSCNGEYACTRMEDYTTEVGTESCVGSHACYKNSDNISDASCNGFYGCYQNSAEIGRDSCNGKLSCENNSGGKLDCCSDS